MAIPVLKLNLAPPPTLWRRQHGLLSWAALALGTLALLLALGLTWRAYHQAKEAGLSASRLSRKAQEAQASQGSIQAQLRSINVQKELPRWKLAERILGERSSPWSRLTAELERSLVQDVRIRTLQRSRGSNQQVTAKLKGEANSREAEAAFVESIQKNAFFSQVILERESERQGGGVEFEFSLPLAAIPPPYVPLPKYSTARAKAVQPASAKPAAAEKTAPARPSPAPAKPAPAPARPASGKPVPALAPARTSGIAIPAPSPGSLRPQHPRDPRPDPEHREMARRPGETDRPSREVKR